MIDLDVQTLIPSGKNTKNMAGKLPFLMVESSMFLFFLRQGDIDIMIYDISLLIKPAASNEKTAKRNSIYPNVA